MIDLVTAMSRPLRFREFPGNGGASARDVGGPPADLVAPKGTVARGLWRGPMGTDDVSRLRGIHVQEVRRMCREGEIPGAWKHSRGYWLIPYEEIMRLEDGYGP